MSTAIDKQATLQPVFDAINANPGRDHSTNQMARLVGYDPSHFTRIFRAATGMTLTDYVAHARGKAAGLSSRELYVLYRIALGHPRKTIAANMRIGENGVAMILLRMLPKLGAIDAANAVYVACQRGLLPRDGGTR